MRAHLAEGYDEDALPAGNAQAGHSQVVEVLATQLGGAHIPPARLRKARHPGVLQHLCRASELPSDTQPGGIACVQTAGDKGLWHPVCSDLYAIAL